MLKDVTWRPYLKYGVIAALLYSIPVYFFLRDASFTEAWLLYLGNLFFCVIITLFLFHFNTVRNQNAGTLVMLTAGQITAGIGIVLSCLVAFIMLVIFVPGLFQPGVPGKVLENAPVNTVKDRTRGLAFMIFANAVVGNIFTAGFVSIVFPFSLKRIQTREKETGKKTEL